MPRFEITAPNGKRYEITAPDGATKDDALKYFQQNHWPKIQQEAKPVQSVAEAEQDSLSKMAAVTDPQNDVLRGLELGARGFSDSALEGIGAIPDLISDGMRETGLPAPEPDFYKNKLKEWWRGLGETVSAPLNAVAPNMGDMAPTSTTDKAIYGAGRGAADAASVFLPAAGIAKVSKSGGLTKGAAQTLASQKGAQAAAGAVGGSVGEATGSPYLGTAAALATGVAPSVAQAVRGSARAANEAKKIIQSAPTREELARQGSQLFDRAKSSTAVIDPDSFASFLAKAERELADAGSDPKLHPTLSNVMGALSKRIGNELDFQDLQNARRVAAISARSLEPDESRLGSMLVEKFDDYVSNLSARDIVRGEVGTATRDLKEARSLWSRMRKSEMVDEVFEKAKNAASGYENGLRQGFRAILNSEKKRRAFSTSEIRAMRAVVRGTAKGNTLKRLSRLGFGTGQQSNFLGGTIGIGVGSEIGGTTGAMIAPAIGRAAAKGAERSTQRSADLVKALVASGQKLPENNTPLLNDFLNARLAQTLAAREKSSATSPQMVSSR